MSGPDDGMTVPTVDTPLPYTTAWTDGSSTGKWGPGGWAWCVIDGPRGGRHDAGGHPNTTNQRMELLAAHEAVKALPGLLLVVSDSQYVVRCFTDQWWKGWDQRDWRKVANVDLWQPFIADVLDRNGEVRFAWVRGHVGHPGNEQADQLAKAAKDRVALYAAAHRLNGASCTGCDWASADRTKTLQDDHAAHVAGLLSEVRA